MLVIGSHLSIAKGFTKAAENALEMGANTFQFFSRNPRGSNSKAFDVDDIKSFQKIRKDNDFGPLSAHAPYTMNLASAKDDVYEFATRVIKEDIQRMDGLSIEYLCMHPGSHIGCGIDTGIDKIIYGLNQGITKDQSITVLLETMSGKGTEIGFKFEHLKRIIDGVNLNEKLGVCLDLCHVFSAGYDIIKNLDKVLEDFDKTIGIDRLKIIHLNDSMMPFGANKDRHTTIGEGEIGMQAIINFMSHPSIKDKPFFLETPLDIEGHKKEIKTLKDILGYD